MAPSVRRFSEYLSASDLRLTRFAQQLSHRPWGLNYFAAVSRLGDGIAWYCLMLLLLLFGGEVGQQAALQMAVVGLSSLVLYKGLKWMSKRPRPLAVERSLQTRVAPLDEFSFPSGHTLHAVAFTLVATTHIPELGIVLWPFCASVAMSRVALGLHYPSDVLAAIGLGWCLSAGSTALMFDHL